MDRRIRIIPKFLSLFCLVLLGLWPHTSPAYERIISLKPNLTEILFDLGVGEKVVAVTTFCDRPKQVRELPVVADYVRIQTEKVLKLTPDLIVGSKENSSQKELEFLEARGIQVKLYPFGTLSQMLSSIQKLGQLFGKEEVAQKLNQQIQKNLDSLKQKAQKVTKQKALFVVGYQPLVVVGGNNFIDDSKQYLGLTNVIEASRMKYPSISTERLIRSAPEVIIDLSMGTEKKASTWQERLDWWHRFPSLPAVQDGKIYAFEIQKIRAVPQYPQALEELFAILHPKTGKTLSPATRK